VAEPFRTTSTGLALAIRLTPKAAHDGVTGLHGAADELRIAVSVRAIPDKGRANQAAISVLAAWLDLPKTQFSLASGAKSRAKIIAVTGDAHELAAHVTHAVGCLGQPPV
jgi:uncharacterized protein